MIEKIKKDISILKGKKTKIFVDVGRNKREEYEGVILETYNKVLTFKTDTDIKSFCYSDILINNVIISSL